MTIVVTVVTIVEATVIVTVPWCRQMEYQEVLLKLQGSFASMMTRALWS
jgi:hypothetical protein